VRFHIIDGDGGHKNRWWMVQAMARVHVKSRWWMVMVMVNEMVDGGHKP
jgi:hypothetical protein